MHEFYVNKLVGSIKIEIPPSMIVEKLQINNSNNFKLQLLIGKNNFLYLGDNINIKKLNIQIKGNNNKIFIGSKCILKGTISIHGHMHTVFIGSSTTFNNASIICKGNGNVYIGKDCMFSSGIEMRCADGHSIIDIAKKAKTNISDGIYIGDHVWVAKNVLLQKGLRVADDNVIGYGALARGDFPLSQSVIVGVPARVVKTGFTWSRDENIVNIDDEVLTQWTKLPLLTNSVSTQTPKKQQVKTPPPPDNFQRGNN